MVKALDSYNTCAAQPYLGDDQQVNLLLRNHNFAAGVNTPVGISYNVIVNPTFEHRYKADFWNNEGYEIRNIIEYISESISDIIKISRNGVYVDGVFVSDQRYIPEFITGFENRDAYRLYECNYLNSNDQLSYVLEVKLENIKRKLRDYQENNLEELEQFKWLESVDSVFDLMQPYASFPISIGNKRPDNSNQAVEPTKDQLDKANSIIDHVFSSASKVANIKFTSVFRNENLGIKLKFVQGDNKESNRHPGGDYRYDKSAFREGTGDEYFNYVDGKTIYTEYNGWYSITDHDMHELTWKDIYHQLSHFFIDHPNDSVFAPELYLNNNQQYSLDVSYEYRADNACMSVMSFNECVYQGRNLQPISYLPIDILALQHMYSANKATEVEDTKYIFTDKQVYINDINHPMFEMEMPIDALYTLYDAGGLNSLDVSSVLEPVIIDLEQGAGHFNKVGKGTFLIDYNTLISDVIIGAADASVRLNDEANKIFVPAKDAHVFLANVGPNDLVILSSEANINIVTIDGCIHPYSDSGDLETEICVEEGSYIGVSIMSDDVNAV